MVQMTDRLESLGSRLVLYNAVTAVQKIRNMIEQFDMGLEGVRGKTFEKLGGLAH